jgi:hypothetical protein
MPIADIAILSLIIFAFVAFAVVLAWGDHQTRDIAAASRARALAGAAPTTQSKPRPEVAPRAVERKKPQREPVHA